MERICAKLRWAKVSTLHKHSNISRKGNNTALMRTCDTSKLIYLEKLVRSVFDDLLSHRVRTLPRRASLTDDLVAAGWITKEVEQGLHWGKVFQTLIINCHEQLTRPVVEAIEALNERIEEFAVSCCYARSARRQIASCPAGWKVINQRCYSRISSHGVPPSLCIDFAISFVA